MRIVNVLLLACRAAWISLFHRCTYSGRLSLILCSLFAAQAFAANTTWQVPSGDWSDNGNWSTAAPGQFDIAIVSSNGTATITQVGAVASELCLGDNTGAGTLKMPSGTLTASTILAGCAGPGTVLQSGGTASVPSGSLYLGFNPGSYGNYSLGGNGMLAAASQFVGYSGTGSFTQSGGINTAPTELFLGYNAGASGSYQLSGSGLLTAASEYIGWDPAAKGFFQQSSGTNHASYLTVGSSGSYQLVGGALQIAASGGLHIDGILDGANGSGSIQVAQRSLVDLTMATLVNTGSMSLTIGANSLLIVPNGFNPATHFASYSNAGTVHTAGTNLTIAAGQSVEGTGPIHDPVNCQGAIATSDFVNATGGIVISGSGNVNLGSGNLTTDDLASTMSGGQLVGLNHYVGYSSTGSFTQTGGAAAMASYLYVGFNPSSSGSYNLGGSGQLASNWQSIGFSGTGNFAQSGGTNSVALFLTLGGNSDGLGSYALSNGRLSAVRQYVGFAGSGNFQQSGGSNGSTSTSLQIGYASASSGNYTLSGSGQLDTRSLLVGNSGTGQFTQTGGNSTAASDLRVGYRAGGNGTFNLNGNGSVSALIEYVGDAGNGTFSQSGGTNRVDEFGALSVGNQAIGSGAYNLSGSGSLDVPTEYVGYSGSGSFTQSGGTNTTADGLYLAYSPGSVGTYRLNGGLLMLNVLNRGSGMAEFDFSGGTLQATGDLWTDVPLTLLDVAGMATIDSAGHSVTLAGAITGLGGLTKTNSATLALSGANNFTGCLDVLGGTVQLVNSAALADGLEVEVEDGGTLAFGALPGAGPVPAPTPVPEPGTLGLLAVASLIAAAVRQHPIGRKKCLARRSPRAS